MPTWNAAMAVGHKTIDAQHQELFQRADALMDAMLKGKTAAEMKGLLVFLRDYCKSHFSMEERLMAQTGFPLTASHGAQHREFERRFAEAEQSMAEFGATSAVVLEVKGLIYSWLVDHIAVTDTKLAGHLAKARLAATA